LERTNTANSLGADLYISNHVNSGGGCGSEVWYSIVGGDSKAYAVAAGNAQKRAGTSRPEWGEPLGEEPYGDDPKDQLRIKQGIAIYLIWHIKQ